MPCRVGMRVSATRCTRLARQRRQAIGSQAPGWPFRREDQVTFALSILAIDRHDRATGRQVGQRALDSLIGMHLLARLQRCSVRSSGRSVVSPAGGTAELAAVEHKRRRLRFGPEGTDAQDHDAVVSGWDLVVDRAFELGDRAVNEHPPRGGLPLRAGEPVPVLGCQRRTRRFLTLSQHADPEPGQPHRAGHLADLIWARIDTSGGSSDTLVNELAANPTGRASSRPPTAVTPYGNSQTPTVTSQDPRSPC